MTTTPSCRIGIDIGGTFTDIVVIDARGRTLVMKVPSTPQDYSLGIASGIEELLAEHAIDPASVDGVVHATTVATNAILEGKGAKTGLVTTEGFRDVLEFRRVRVPELYNLHYVKPAPLVPRALRLEVRERVGPGGTVRVALDEATVRVAGERLARAGVEAVAICLLHAYANSAHERRIKEILVAMLPESCFVCCSHEVLPEIREYERTSTTVVNAFLGPVMSGYLGAVHARLADVGIKQRMQIMQSGGGQMGVTAALARPAYLVESGPAAGVIAAARTARRAGLGDVITLDIGGTTAKTAMVENGEPAKTSEYEIGAGINLSSKLVNGAGYAIKLPFIDVSEIGAGGGSHVWFDPGGLMKVGPRSAGAHPGPVCYGRGGTHVTLTDSLLALGYVNPQHLVGGALPLDARRALHALDESVGAVLGQSRHAAAFGVFNVATANMVRAVKSVSTYRGRDPRAYTLIAFGGNGPVVAAAVAEDLGMTQVLVPPNPGVFSAHGLLLADSEHETVRSFPGLVSELPSRDLERALDELARDASQQLVTEGFDPGAIRVRQLMDLRYAGQAFELTVPLVQGMPCSAQQIAAQFHAEHARWYGHSSEGEPVELVNLRVVAKVANAVTQSMLASAAVELPPASQRIAYFGAELGAVTTPVLTRGHVAREPRPGPLIIEEYDATIVVPPGWQVTVDEANNVRLSGGQ